MTGLCTHCLLCLHWSLCLFLFTFMHTKYTGVCVPGLALTHLCFFCFGAPSLGAARGQALHTLASHCPEACWMGPCCGEGRWHSPPVLSTISVLTISGNLNSPPDPRLPIIIWSSADFGTRLQGRWGGPGSIQVDCRLLHLPMRWASLENASHDLQCLMGREGPWKESEGTPKSWKARTPYFPLP